MVEETANKQNKKQILVPKGKNFASAPALIYVQVFYHRDRQQTLDAKNSNERWLSHVPNARSRRCRWSSAATARWASCALPPKIRAAPSRPTSSAPSGPTQAALEGAEKHYTGLPHGPLKSPAPPSRGTLCRAAMLQWGAAGR